MRGIQEPVGCIPRKGEFGVSSFIIHKQILACKGKFEENHKNLNARNSFLFVGIGFFQTLSPLDCLYDKDKVASTCLTEIAYSLLFQDFSLIVTLLLHSQI